ncbi:Peptidase M20/M25/M40 family protein [Perilla frutescens var. hirtella]|uniref:N-acyl-aliphatic-L-amino acid amidohydrolase n=1 Tax=Perilla frutescens var. hirtella TaxID=608512 RepID=A0AAD4JM23_PERFH|nr:Peptidase M20/M25/M40 family protein [Perilla frutescens var. hirtella]
MNNGKLVRKVHRFLPKKFAYKVAVIEEVNDIKSMRLDKLMGSLRTFEMDLEDEDISSRKRDNRRRTTPLHRCVTVEKMIGASHKCQSLNHLALLVAGLLLLLPTRTISVIDKDSSSIISRFQEYLRINTAQPNPSYYEAADFINSQAKSLSLDYQVLEFAKGKPLLLLKWAGKNPALPSILLNSHTDVVPAEHHKWNHPPFEAHLDPSSGHIYARGSQDMKCVGLQYLEAIRKLQASGYRPLRTVYLSFVPDEEIGGHDGVEKFADSDIFKNMNVGIVLDEGLASPTENYRVFYGERSPWWLVIKATGAPGHGAKLYDNTAMENLLKSIESIRRFRASQFDLIKSGLKAEGEVTSVNMVFLKAGTPSPTGFVMNLQPSEAQAGFDIRVPPTADAASLERRIVEEWAPVSRNMTFEFKQRASLYDKFGKPLITASDSSNPWWGLLEKAIKDANGKLGTPEIFPAATDSRYFRELGLPAIGFSPMANTPILLHDHNEFLNKDEYLRGIGIYESIIKAYASYAEPTKDEASREEL